MTSIFMVSRMKFNFFNKFCYAAYVFIFYICHLSWCRIAKEFSISEKIELHKRSPYSSIFTMFFLFPSTHVVVVVVVDDVVVAVVHLLRKLSLKWAKCDSI